ncbi:delta(3,5)-Delta(2,4)-dienoyl-CoA isomerase, mitochondrial-like [Etheostoma spectabile]|uniref:delta(3,5)-Delta(2,4)-dienoyl-CoA isomerase, mitochondrial-like n=1 Tax=Etheostoma spectabile TaxID=54343 RepID=UPI0013AFE232|nr:delta(3,5)-Delta(2,4)-dienoyl-CoA isomerase, mitochondrial-like [Etheostoma spectabile]
MLSVVRSALATYGRSRLPGGPALVRSMSSSGGGVPPYTTLAISHPAESITHVELHRPEKRNAMNKAFWSEMVDCFNEIAGDPECRVVVVSGAGKMFTAGRFPREVRLPGGPALVRSMSSRGGGPPYNTPRHQSPSQVHTHVKLHRRRRNATP